MIANVVDIISLLSQLRYISLKMKLPDTLKKYMESIINLKMWMEDHIIRKEKSLQSGAFLKAEAEIILALKPPVSGGSV